MSLEIEKRFKNFDYIYIKNRLTDLGFEHFGDFLFQITTYKGVVPNQVIRVRDEGFRVSFTIKLVDPNGYETEFETNVGDYNMLNMMLDQLKLEKHFELQKYREIYRSTDGKNEVIFDNFPGLHPYMEIESKTEEDLFKTMELLGVVEEKKFAGGDLYLETYGITKNRPMFPLTFVNADKYMDEYITHDKEKFIELLQNQQKRFLIK